MKNLKRLLLLVLLTLVVSCECDDIVLSTYELETSSHGRLPFMKTSYSMDLNENGSVTTDDRFDVEMNESFINSLVGSGLLEITYSNLDSEILFINCNVYKDGEIVNSLSEIQLYEGESITVTYNYLTDTFIL